MFYDADEMEVQELRAEQRYLRSYRTKLLAHPSCRDPDHPGCDACEDAEQEDNELLAEETK